MSDLLSFYKSRFSLLDDKEMIQAILQGEAIDTHTSLSLIRNCEDMVIETPQMMLAFYRNLLHVVLMLSLSQKKDRSRLFRAKNLLKKGEIEGYWHSFPLSRAFFALSSYLVTGTHVELDAEQLERERMFFEFGHHSVDSDVIRPIESVYLSLSWLYLGVVSRNETLIRAALKLTSFCMHFCDKTGALFQGLWTKEWDYCPSILYSALFLLFSVTSCLFYNEKMLEMKSLLFQRLQEVQKNRVDLLILLFEIGFQRLIEGKPSYPNFSSDLVCHDIDVSLGFMRYTFQDLHLACTACGVNTGLGAVHKHAIHIVSFGPHFYPLSDPRYFGIYRTSNGSKEGFKDLAIQHGEERCRFQGWVRLISPLLDDRSKQCFSSVRPGRQWVFFDMRVEGADIQLNVRLNQCLQTFPLAFVFFVSADKVHLGEGRELLPRSLEKYQGCATTLTLEKEGKSCLLCPQFMGEMEVIPLEGQGHFWSADFLIAFPLTQALTLYSWKF